MLATTLFRRTDGVETGWHLFPPPCWASRKTLAGSPCLAGPVRPLRCNLNSSTQEVTVDPRHRCDALVRRQLADLFQRCTLTKQSVLLVRVCCKPASPIKRSPPPRCALHVATTEPRPTASHPQRPVPRTGWQPPIPCAVGVGCGRRATGVCTCLPPWRRPVTLNRPARLRNPGGHPPPPRASIH